MPEVELELWTDGDRDDYARVLSDLDEEDARSLYEFLLQMAYDWLIEKKIDAEVFRRTTGRNVQVSDVLRWYVEEGFLEEVFIDDQRYYRPSTAVEEALESPPTGRTLIPVDELRQD